jgi:hypothetical protein
MITHLEKVHHDYGTDPRVKANGMRRSIVRLLKEWKGL